MRCGATIVSTFVVLSVLLSACTVRPHNVLSSKEMENVLYDLHRTEGILQAKGYGYNRDEENAGYYEAVLRKHGVTQAQFDSSLVWYTDNPRRFDKIYPKVIDRLKAQKDVLAKANTASFEALRAGQPVFTQAKLDSTMQVLREGYTYSLATFVDTLAWRDVQMVSYVFPIAVQDSLRNVQVLLSDSNNLQ